MAIPTDKMMKEAPLTLVPVDQPALFGDAVARLAADRTALDAARSAGRECYERHFDWPVIAKRFLAVAKGCTDRWD
jgi:glycosyltransferase involved in cell wall biosynthesis